MCLVKAPSCGVHSLLGERHRYNPDAPVMGLRWYAKGCHACDALVDQFGLTRAALGGEA